MNSNLIHCILYYSSIKFQRKKYVYSIASGIETGWKKRKVILHITYGYLINKFLENVFLRKTGSKSLTSLLNWRAKEGRDQNGFFKEFIRNNHLPIKQLQCESWNWEFDWVTEFLKGRVKLTPSGFSKSFAKGRERLRFV